MKFLSLVLAATLFAGAAPRQQSSAPSDRKPSQGGRPSHVFKTSGCFAPARTSVRRSFAGSVRSVLCLPSHSADHDGLAGRRPRRGADSPTSVLGELEVYGLLLSAETAS
jgi:hypothetical protein